MGTSHRPEPSKLSPRSDQASNSSTMKVFVLLALVAAATAAPAFFPVSTITSGSSIISPTVYSSTYTHGLPTTFLSGSPLTYTAGSPLTYTAGSPLPYTAGSPFFYNAVVPKTVVYNAPAVSAVVPKSIAQTPGSSHITY